MSNLAMSFCCLVQDPKKKKQSETFKDAPLTLFIDSGFRAVNAVHTYTRVHTIYI